MIFGHRKHRGLCEGRPEGYRARRFDQPSNRCVFRIRIVRVNVNIQPNIVKKCKLYEDVYEIWRVVPCVLPAPDRGTVYSCSAVLARLLCVLIMVYANPSVLPHYSECTQLERQAGYFRQCPRQVTVSRDKQTGPFSLRNTRKPQVELRTMPSCKSGARESVLSRIYIHVLYTIMSCTINTPVSFKNSVLRRGASFELWRFLPDPCRNQLQFLFFFITQRSPLKGLGRQQSFPWEHSSLQRRRFRTPGPTGLVN